MYDYDLDKYTKDRLELDPEGKTCAAEIWVRYPLEKGEKVYRIDFEVRLAIKNYDVRVVKCPKTINVVIIHEDKANRK